MKTGLLIVQIITATLLIVIILIQTGGKGFARSWGSSASFTRRGLEKVVFRATFVVAAVFVIVSILQLTF